MTDRDTKKDCGQECSDAGFRGSDDTGLERALDVALAKYAAVEPRRGLEDRILANLRSEQPQAAPRSWWSLGLAGAIAALLIVAVAIAWRSSRPTPPVAHRPPVGAPAPKQLEPQVAAGNHGTAIHPHRRNGHASQSSHAAATVAAVPKLDVFPSPQPLSEQEKLLAGYIEKNPEHAALLAEARMESLRREAEERSMIAAEGQSSQQ